MLLPRVLKQRRLRRDLVVPDPQPPHHLERPGANRHGLPHDDTLAHALNPVLLHAGGRVKQVVRRLLKRRQLQHAVAHLGQAEPRDAQDLALVRHDVGQQLHVARVDAQIRHDGADLVGDGRARRLDAQHVAALHHRVGHALGADHALGRHARP